MKPSLLSVTLLAVLIVAFLSATSMCAQTEVTLYNFPSSLNGGNPLAGRSPTLPETSTVQQRTTQDRGRSSNCLHPLPVASGPTPFFTT